MNPNDLETEVKFYVQDLPALEAKLNALDPTGVRPRLFELNLRFDTPAAALQAAHQVLRLRQDENAYMTFKGNERETDGVVTRSEIEVKVEDFFAGQRLLEALGYKVVFVYEKYRAIYSFEDTQVMLDELPYGSFVEIEGRDENIRALARMLGLKWGHAIPASYHLLFENMRTTLGLDFRDLTFANFQNMNVPPDRLNLRPAD
jgi:adenylate cyclase, class 2